MAGVMSGAVTNTPGPWCCAGNCIRFAYYGNDKSIITLAYAVTYPLGVFGIIGSLLLLKKIFNIKIEKEQELPPKAGSTQIQPACFCSPEFRKQTISGAASQQTF